ncbi:putative beta-mannosidase [Exophiala viscosa]|uniref:Beta-mannosidase A n=1 Tax=Exophiala viscosa TaxID=2486360 RepID=A0AAN6IA62_9EURO|nr:putative beta-mannosidase [Exophiala viscosa]
MLLALSFSPLLTAAQTVVSMSDLSWTVTNPNDTISVPGNVPSQAHLDLYNAQVIGDPYYGLNDFNLRWVAETNWTYSASLSALNLSTNASTWLVFNGLDTFSTVTVCDQVIASTNNQFRQYYFEVTQSLSNCTSPTISIDFGSAPNIADALANTSLNEPWPYGTQMTYEFPNRWFIRKEQSDFGWDWGPAFAPAGPWQPAYIVQLGSNKLYVRNTLLDIYRQGQVNNLPPDQTQPWIVNASLDVLGTLPPNAGLRIDIIDANNNTAASSIASNVTSSGGAISGSISVENNSVDLWWPNGMGPQNLYYATVTLLGSSNNSIATSTVRTAFRTILLNMEPISQQQISQGIQNGNNWHFEINGHEFYAKGSNFIPPDAFWPRVTSARIEQLFDSVVDGGQNMLRVWASGAYQPDFIYDIADERGILLWSEFEFSDSLYPVASDFLDNVREEANYNVRRVNHHPSLALWAGGNELENLELQIANESDPGNYSRWLHEYETLFLGVLVPAVYENSRSISYIPSSTTNGYLTLNHSAPEPMIERYNNLTAGSIYGDTDHYDYDSSVAFNLSSYPVGRFANEFGFHSMPSLQTWQDAVAPKDLSFNSSTIQLRNHHYPSGGLNTSNFANSTMGMGEMTIAVQRYYPAPNKSDSLANFSSWCLATQIFQADFYRSQITYYRRGSGMPERQLGSLYWQLEDIWQAPTWAGIEYSGRWKVLHYVAKDVYSRVIVAPYWNYTTGDLTAYVTSDLWDVVSGTVDMTWYDWSGSVLDNTNTSTSVPFTVGALNTTKVLQTNTNTLAQTIDLTNAVLRLNLTAAGYLPNNSTLTTFTHEFWFHPVLSLADARLVDPGLKLTFGNDTANPSWTVEATSGVSAWMWLDFPSGVVGNFDSNGFWLVPGLPRTVMFTVKNDTTQGEWVKNVTVSSLWDFTTP